MSYSAHGFILYGFPISDETAGKLSGEIGFWKEGEVMIQGSGNSCSGVWDNHIGVLIAMSDGYDATELFPKSWSPDLDNMESEDRRDTLQEFCEKHNIEFKEPRIFLISCVI